MAARATATFLPVLSLLLLRAGADDDSAFVYAGCSQGRYDAGTQYESGVDSVLTSLANSAPYAPYANITSPSALPPVAGLYQCRSDLPASVCTGCVRSAISRLSSLCSWSAGGAVQLRSCFVRYGNDSFVGKPNTAVLFKKCGGSPGDAGGAAMRDSALGGLASSVAPAGGGYRAGGAGGGAGHVALKAGCGYASAGEVSLGKCYARFWSNGGGFVSGASSGNGYGFGPRMNGERLALAVGGFFASLAYFSVLLV
uniref:Uncharacterized protein n=1 Tax=Aegilops tauschii TaxID=37682 RepID=M8C528_AEGTA